MINSSIATEQIITLVGPPNSGKTTLFNYLSGKNFKTVNYPGSTIEYHQTKFQDKFEINARLLDSPGIVSLNPNSPDEAVTINSLFDHPKFGKPNLIVVTVDASQLSRHLYLVKQLLDYNVNLLVVLTMMDILKKRGYTISVKDLEQKLNCKVVTFNGRTGEGLDNIVHLIKTEVFEKNDKNYQNHKPIIQSDENQILKYYSEIEIIENKVLKPIPTEKDLLNAEKSLTVINNIINRKPDSLTLSIDRILLHKYWGIFFFLLITGIIFTSIFWAALPLMELVDEAFAKLANYASINIGYNWYGDLISDGLISSVGAVLVFVPQIIILFSILGFLEDTGYLARGAMLIDRPLSKIGLNGRSFVPMLSGFACAIPAMLAARTISNRKERLLTIFIIPLMSCSARLPVYALLIAFLVPKEHYIYGGFIFSFIYLFSIISSIIVAGFINKFSKNLIRAKDDSSFILELPSYKLPKLKSVINNTFSSTKQYLRGAGPIIISLSLILWVMTYFPNVNPNISNENLTEAQLHEALKIERISNSYAAELGKIIQPIMTPIGMDWRIGVSLISAFVAREVFVSALALIFKVTGDEETLRESILNAMRGAKINGTNQKLFTTSTILGLIVFFVFAMQCISTLAVSRKETGSWRIPFLQVIIFTSIAYFAAFVTVNGLRLLGFE